MSKRQRIAELEALLRLVADAKSDLALAAARGIVRKHLGYDRAKDLRNDYDGGIQPRLVDDEFTIDRDDLAEARQAVIDKYIHN